MTEDVLGCIKYTVFDKVHTYCPAEIANLKKTVNLKEHEPGFFLCAECNICL